MALNKPYFSCKPTGDSDVFDVHHNCDGATSFGCSAQVDDKTARLINMAIEEGKRIRSRELMRLLQGD